MALIKKDYNEIQKFLSKYKDYYTGIYEAFEKMKGDIELIDERTKKELLAAYFTELTQSKTSCELNKLLKEYTLDMLVGIYEEACKKNPDLAVRVNIIIIEINSKINNLNTVAYESGIVFNKIKNMTEEEKCRLLELNEVKEKISFTSIIPNKENIIETQVLKSEVRELIEKSLNGSNLDEERKKFYLDLGLETEKEIEFYVASMHNKSVVDAVSELFSHIPVEEEYEEEKENMKNSFINSNLSKKVFKIQ